MNTAATTEIEIHDVSSAPPNSSNPASGDSLLNERMTWYELKRQKPLLIFFPLLGVTSLLIFRSFLSYLSSSANLDWKQMLIIWPALHFTFAGVLAFGPDFERQSWLWEQWLPANWKRKITPKILVSFLSPLFSFVPILLLTMVKEPETNSILGFLQKQDYTLTLPFSLLAILLTILTPTILRNLVLVVATAFLLSGISFETTEFLLARFVESDQSAATILFVLRCGLGSFALIAIPYTFRWRMQNESRFELLGIGQLFSSNLAPKAVSIPKSFGMPLTIARYFAQKNFWLLASLVIISIAYFSLKFAGYKFIRNSDAVALFLLVISILATGMWGTAMGDRQREFLRQFPVNPLHFFGIGLSINFILPFSLFLLCFWTNVATNYLMIVLIPSVFIINTWMGLFFRSKLIAWFLGSSIGFIHWIIVSSSLSICNATFQLYLCFTVLPFLVSICRNAPDYFQENSLRFFKPIAFTIGIWAVSISGLLIAGRIFSIPSSPWDPNTAIILKTEFEVPDLPEVPKWIYDRSIQEPEVAFNNHGHLWVNRSNEDEPLQSQLFRPVNTHPNSYADAKMNLSSTSTLYNPAASNISFAYATKKPNKKELVELKEYVSNRISPSLAKLEASLNAKSSYKKVKLSTSESNQSLVNEYYLRVSSWIRICNDSFEVALQTGNKNLALKALDLRNKLSEKTMEYHWMAEEFRGIESPYSERYLTLVFASNSWLVSPYANHWDSLEGFSGIYHRLPKPIDEFKSARTATSIAVMRRNFILSKRNSWKVTLPRCLGKTPAQFGSSNWSLVILSARILILHTGQ